MNKKADQLQMVANTILFYVKGHSIIQGYNIYNSCVKWPANNSVLTSFVSVPFPPLVEQRSQRSVVYQIWGGKPTNQPNLAQKLKKECEMEESCHLYASYFSSAIYIAVILYHKSGKCLKLVKQQSRRYFFLGYLMYLEAGILFCITSKFLLPSIKIH